ncbi:MAG: tRNA threonylcarbamoyladenosine dehydratase [Pseudomonadota bacterium]
MEILRRFTGIERLYGTTGTACIAQTHIAVIGVGGVGSWAVEAFARSGISTLTLIDSDHVAESNINRQSHALTSTLGRCKIDVLAERVADIHPTCQVRCIDQFIESDNLMELISLDYDWVVDCIDNFRLKAALIAHCRRQHQSVLTVGAAGGQQDPTRICCSDLRRTTQDALLARTRKQLRQIYRFPRNPARCFGVPAVWSPEPITRIQVCMPQTDHSLNCAGFGACMPVTATFGLVAAAHILKKITQSG